MSRYKTLYVQFLSVLVALVLLLLFLNTLSNRGEDVCQMCSSIRTSVVNKIYASVPSPHAELILGTTFGIDLLQNVPRFNDMLKSTGTIHVVVVSGYNISLVINRFLNLFKASKSFIKVFSVQVFAFFYAILTGFEPPVVRALLMASVVLWARHYGKKLHVLLVLIATAGLMIVADLSYATSLSFQLSFLATLGIVILSPAIEPFIKNLFGDNMFVSDFIASLSAQVFVMPLLFYHFGVFNIKGVLVNAFTLWTIPLITLVGYVIILLMYIPSSTHFILGTILTLISDIFVNLIQFSS